MNVFVVYKDDTDHARPVLDFLREFERQTARSLTTYDPDTKEGSAFCVTYDIVEYPTVVALDDSGQLLQIWRGLPLPTISEVSFYDAA